MTRWRLLGAIVLVALLSLAGSVSSSVDEREVLLEWPRRIGLQDGGRLEIYQPQVERWPDAALLRTRVVISWAPTATDEAILGSMVVDADTEVDLGAHLIRASGFEVHEVFFPDLGEVGSKQLRARIQQQLPDDLLLPLEQVLAGLHRGQLPESQVELASEAPPIFVSFEPAVLVQFDGEPVFSPTGSAGLEFAVNTNWDLFRVEAEQTYLLLLADAWVEANEVGNRWSVARKLPKSLDTLPSNDHWARVRAHVGGRKPKRREVPKIFVSTRPAELIVIDGKPSLEPVAGTDLLVVANTESDLFFHPRESRFFFLVSGRWFGAESLEGPWSFATESLPSDFSRIPDGHPRGHVSSSVPGTAAAREAVILSGIPRKATFERSQMKAPEVQFLGGDPQWLPIEGTSLSYAANTSSDVIGHGDRYYLCLDGVWFTADSAAGPWVLADQVPEEIYSIPPSSPLHRTAHVRVYGQSPSEVTFGHTSGYRGVYVGWGVAVFGTGWRYPPYVSSPGADTHPVYLGHPVSYGMAARYHAPSGAFLPGGKAYGPHGGLGRTAAYDPRSGQAGKFYEAWGAAAGRPWEEWLRSARAGAPRESAGAAEGTHRSDPVVRGENDLYAGRDGNIFRLDEAGWHRYESGRWLLVEAPPEDPAARGPVSGPAAREVLQRAFFRNTYNQLMLDHASRVRGDERTSRYLSWLREESPRP